MKEMPKDLYERIRNVKDEDIIFLDGKAIHIQPATESDIKRVAANFKLHD